MKNYYFKMLAFAAMTSVSADVLAIDPPLKSESLVDGTTYVLFNYANPSQVLSRTSWDGAYYLLDEASSNYLTGTGDRTVPFVAHQAEDGTWSFSVEENEMITSYVGLRSGGGNVHGNLAEPAYWEVVSSPIDGFYQMKVGAGHPNGMVEGLYLHLNGGCQYLVTSYEGDTWFPDFYGGLQTETDIDDNIIYLMEEDGINYKLNDPSSRYWAFVQPENVPAVVAKAKLYSAIKDLEDNYVSNEGFEKGFQDAIDAATNIYTTDPLYQEDIDEALAIINGKIALFKEIEMAYTILGDASDVAFEKAIDAAISQFNTVNNASDLANALTTLKKAETDYQMGTGDVTSLGNNMSFEDLSAQSGQTTTGVGNAPAGWNLYLNGAQVTTADEIRGKGITAWCGVNGDATGAKDQNYIFGIWNSGMPAVEISQTIEGLDNGVYAVTAAVMVGSNGNGSRRTTQRIFGNLNSQYFGAQYEYNEDLLDKGEVYGFAELTEPYTDTELQDMTVEAFVYDGTLTFGFRTDANIAAANRTESNGAGGDGWFKVDNFRITKQDFDPSVALNIYDYFLQQLASTIESGAPMQRSVMENAESLVGNQTIDESSTQEEIIAAFLALKDAYPVVKSSIDAYQKLSDAIEDAVVTLEEYGNSLGANEFGDIIMEAEMALDDAEIDEAGVEAMIERLEVGAEEMKKKVIESGQEITSLVLKNPSFEDLSSQNNAPTGGSAPAPKGWNLYIDGELQTVAPPFGWCGINGGDDISGQGAIDENGDVISVQYVDGSYLWGIWNGTIPSVELSQKLSLPAGTYTLTCNMMVEYNWANNCITTQRLFANSSVCMFAGEMDYEYEELPADAQAAKAIDDNALEGALRKLNFAGYTCTSDDPYTHTLRPMTLTFGVDESGEAVIGFRTDGKVPTSQSDSNEAGAGWFKLDNFRLSYDSEEIPTSIKCLEGIEDVAREVSGQEYYSVGGARLEKLQKGVNIVKTTLSDGSVKVSKTFVK